MLLALVFSASEALATESTPSPYLWADERDGVLEIDVTGDSGYPIDALHEDLSTKYKRADSGMFDVLPEDTPAFLKGRSELDAITVGGVRKVAVKRLEISLGASSTHLYIHTDTPSKSPALIVLEGKAGKGACLRRVEGASSSRPGPAVAARIFAAATKPLTPDVRKALARARLNAASLHFTPGTFAQKAPWLVWIDAPVGKGDVEQHFDFAALVTADGKVVDTIAPAALTEDWWRPLGVVDADGDGQDELVGQPYYYEGEKVVLYRWVGGRRQDFTLTGDGA